MDLRKLKTLIDLVSESNVSELEITEAEGKVRIVKSGGAVVQQYVAAPMQAAPVAAASAPLRPQWPNCPARRSSPSRGHVVKSADGGHVLPLVQPRCQAVRRSRAARSKKARPCASSRP